MGLLCIDFGAAVQYLEQQREATRFMVQNIAESFVNLQGEEDSLIHHFIKNSHIRLLGCGTCRTSKTVIRDFMLPAFLAVCYKMGETELCHGGQKTLLQPGSFYIFRPNQVYTGTRVSAEPLAFVYLQYDMAPFMDRYQFGKVALTDDDALFASRPYRRFGEMLTELAEDAPDRTGRSAMLRQLVEQITAQILYDRSGPDGLPGLLRQSRESRLVECAFQYVDSHLAQPLVIGDILQYASTSKTSLERAFRSMLGVTPRQALLRFKVERAMELLQQNKPLKDIARLLGFSSAFHFSNSFFSVTGTRPTDYRNRLIGGGERAADEAAG